MTFNQREQLYQNMNAGGLSSATHWEYPEAAAGAWDSYTKRWIATNDGVTLTPSVVSLASGGPPASVMQIGSSGGVAHSQHREFFLRPDKNFRYSEIRSIVFLGDMTAGATQAGHVHNWQMINSTTSRAYVCWTDALFGQANWINMGIWQSDGTTLTLYGDSGTHIPISPAPTLPVTACSRASNTVTCIVPGRHYLQVGETVKTVLPNSGGLDSNSVAVASVSGATVTYPLTGSAVTDGGGGTIQKVGNNVLNNAPYHLATRLVSGNVLQAKLWRVGDAEVPWSMGLSSSPAVSLPSPPSDSPGFCGVMAGHLGAGQSIRFSVPQYIGY